MNSIAIADLISHCTVAVYALEDGQIYSKGSGVVIDPFGTVITADHVITNNAKLTIEELKNGSIFILCKGRDGQYKPYIPIIWGIFIEADYLKKPIKLDLALLRPKIPVICDRYPQISTKVPILGEEIMVGGFPEDISMPFSVDKCIKYEMIKGFTCIESTKKQLELFNRFLMVKKAIISNCFPFQMRGSGFQINGSIFYFDNAMHRGGSGGPILNEKGELLGIISERAVIELNYEDSVKGKIPSGSGWAISCDPIFQYISQQSNICSS